MPQNSFRKIIYLSFDADVMNQPVVCNLSRNFDLCFNILKAQITPRQEGHMIMEISGLADAYQDGMDYLKEHGVTISGVEQKISRDEASCIHCGMCTALCPTKALSIDLQSRFVTFDLEKCSACGMCTTVCPVKAMDVQLDNGS
ncbi:NIL domain-containing protein [Desulfovibrio inopinatus]|uniref:NIL domain-containing protein n=1 Tax=Desulfovibrio inopinatus TaxID=102109 RepID=UPI00040B5325|nr:NIL domain-containing protein [Desulfovibrio inopinatus]